MVKPTSLGGRLLVKLADQRGFVARSKLEPLWDAYRELLDATARDGWAAGTRNAADAIHQALGREHENAASEAARGILHLSPKVDTGSKSAKTIDEAATEVDLRLRELGLRHLVASTRRDPISSAPRDLLVRPYADDSLLAAMVYQARWFVLRHGRRLSDAEALERLGSPS